MHPIVGDWVTTDGLAFTGVIFGGLAASAYENKSGEGWRIVQIVDANNSIVDVGFTVGVDTDTLTAGTLYYQLSCGLNTSVSTGYGWGIGGWGSSTWGGPSSVLGYEALQLRLWSFGNRGEDMIASPRGGEIYYWSVADSVDPTTYEPVTGIARRAVTLEAYATAHSLSSVDIPESNNMIFIDDDEGRILSLGCNQFSVSTSTAGDFSPALIRWSDNDLNEKDIFDWGPRSTNTSGGKVLEKGSMIVGFIQTTREKIIWTDIAMYSLRNIGPPDIYNIDVIGEGAGLMSPNAPCDTLDQYRMDFADPYGSSALRAASRDNPRNRPCPTCGAKNVLTPADVALDYQCDRCADACEMGLDRYYERDY